MTHSRYLRRSAGFTVIELLIVMMILGLLVAMGLSAYSAAIAHSRTNRTKVIIAKLDQLIMDKYETYRSRPLPIPSFAGIDPGTGNAYRPGTQAQYRRNALRDLMRMELPDRKTDITVDPCNYVYPLSPPNDKYLAPPSLFRAYRRKAQAVTGASYASWTETSQGAECLYLIISCMRDQEKSSLDFFEPSEIGDVDGDGMPEILDGWGRPIEFLRWAPGYTTEYGALSMQSTNTANAPDPFDPLKLDTTAYYLKPLIFSSGPDKEFDIFTDNVPGTDPSGILTAAPAHRYVIGMGSNSQPPNPYAQFAAAGMMPLPRPNALAGQQLDRDGDGRLEYYDNITNHYQEAE